MTTICHQDVSCTKWVFNCYQISHVEQILYGKVTAFDKMIWPKLILIMILVSVWTLCIAKTNMAHNIYHLPWVDSVPFLPRKCKFIFWWLAAGLHAFKTTRLDKLTNHRILYLYWEKSTNKKLVFDTCASVSHVKLVKLVLGVFTITTYIDST